MITLKNEFQAVLMTYATLKTEFSTIRTGKKKKKKIQVWLLKDNFNVNYSCVGTKFAIFFITVGVQTKSSIVLPLSYGTPQVV